MRWGVDILSAAIRTMWTKHPHVPACTVLHSFLFDLKERLLFADRERTLTVDSRVTWRPMMPPALFALSCVADSSVWIVASKLSLPLSNVYMATAWFHAMSQVFSPLSSKGKVPV